MRDLIDRNELLKVLEERKKPNNGGEDGTKERYRYMQWLTDYNAVIEAPIVEPKKGKWIESNLIPNRKGKPGGRLFICSECNKGWIKQDRSMEGINFCPNCGADMRGEKDGK